MTTVVLDVYPGGFDERADRAWLRELGQAMRTIDANLRVELQRDIEQTFAEEAAELVERLAGLDDHSARQLVADFSRRWPDPTDRMRRRFLSHEVEHRLAQISGRSADLRIAVMERSARDFAPRRRSRARDDPLRDPYGWLAGELDPGNWYRRLFESAAAFDREVSARAPAPPPPGAGAAEPALMADILSVFLPALGGAVTGKLVDLAVEAMRRRRTVMGRKRIVKIYGPNGQVLRDVNVDASDENEPVV